MGGSPAPGDRDGIALGDHRLDVEPLVGEGRARQAEAVLEAGKIKRLAVQGSPGSWRIV
jgi:hypothetical protein